MDKHEVILKVWFSDSSRKMNLCPVLERRIPFEALNASAYIDSVMRIVFGKQCVVVFES